MRLFNQIVPLGFLLLMACQRATDDDVTEDVTSRESVNEFSYQEVAAAVEVGRLKNSDSAKLKTSNTEASGDTKPILGLRDVPEVCTSLSTQRCVSCCEDFFIAGTASWDSCVEACIDGTTAQSIKEY